MKRVIPTLLALAITGCTSFSTLGRARVLEAGHAELWLAPEALIVASESGASVRPIGEAGIRYGVTDELELDARVTTFGFTVGPRVQLYRAPLSTEGVDVAIAPALAWTYSDKLAIEAPVLIGINFGEHQLVLAPRLVYQMRLGVAGQDAPASFLYAGGSISFALRVDPHVTLMPEVALLGQIYSDPGFDSAYAGAAGMQASLGLLFDL